MPLQPPTYIGNLDSTNPRGTDARTISDDVHRNIQESVRMTLPNLTAEVTSTHQDLNLVSGLAAGSNGLMIGTKGVTVAFFYNNTAPPGWTVLEPDANVRGLTIGPVAGGGTIGGSDDPDSYSEALVVAIAGTSGPAGAHNHVGQTETGSAAANVQTSGGTVASTDGHVHNVTVSVVSDHVHGVGSYSGSATTSYQPRYARGILATLNA